MIKPTIPLILVLSVSSVPDALAASGNETDVYLTTEPVIDDFFEAQSPEPTRIPTSNAANPSNSSNSFSLGDLVEQGNSYLDVFEGIVSGGIDNIGGAIGSVVDLITGETSGIGNFLNDLSSLATLVYRVIAIPDQMQGWWNSLINVVTGELSPCTNGADFNGIYGPRVTFEPGWCIGTVTSRQSPVTSRQSPVTSGEDTTNNSGEFLDPVLGEQAPPASQRDPYGNERGYSADDLGGSNASIGTAIANSQGALGLPDLIKLDEELENLNEPGTDFFEVNPVVQKIGRRNLIHRGITQVQAASLLSASGQQAIKEQNEQAANTVTNSYAVASAAQNLNVTQDVMKQAIQLDAHQNLLLAGILGHEAGSRYDNNLGNINLANISRSMDALAKEQRVERAMYARRLSEQLSQSGLW